MTEPTLTPQQRNIMDAIEAGENVFVTGPAGTGKSFMLRHLKETFHSDGLHVTASTGIAAVHVGGVTLHSWAGLGFGDQGLDPIMEYVWSGRATRLRKKLRDAKILAIDEISMLPHTIFDYLNHILKQVRGNTDPFGGLQIILFGDFFQLPPISRESKDPPFCFESDAWHEGHFRCFELAQIFRQEDPEFISFLSRLRNGSLTQKDIDELYASTSQPFTEADAPTCLATHHVQVSRINNHALSRIESESKMFVMKGSGTQSKIEFLKKNCLAPEELVLKKGAHVMMLKNTFQKDGIINGSCGIVVDFSPGGNPVVQFASGKKKIIEPSEWVVEDVDPITMQRKVVASVSQVPLTLAWAMTVHKSQGLTLDRVVCDLGNAFTEGQIYVALSRVRKLGHLHIQRLNTDQLLPNARVKAFYDSLISEDV